MAEADIIYYIIPAVVGLYLVVLLYGLRQFRIKALIPRAPRIFVPHYTPQEKKHFLKGIPIGIILGVLVFAPHLNAIFGGDNAWFFPFIQLYPVILYSTLSVVFTLFKFLAAFTNINFFGTNQGYMDGLFSSFGAVQIIVFIKYPLIFFPILNQ